MSNQEHNQNTVKPMSKFGLTCMVIFIVVITIPLLGVCLWFVGPHSP